MLNKMSKVKLRCSFTLKTPKSGNDSFLFHSNIYAGAISDMAPCIGKGKFLGSRMLRLKLKHLMKKLTKQKLRLIKWKECRM